MIELRSSFESKCKRMSFSQERVLSTCDWFLQRLEEANQTGPNQRNLDLNHQQPLICLCLNPWGSVWPAGFSRLALKDHWKNLCKANHKSHVLSASPDSALIFHWNRGNPIHKSALATNADVALSFSLPHSRFLKSRQEKGEPREEEIQRWVLMMYTLDTPAVLPQKMYA